MMSGPICYRIRNCIKRYGNDFILDIPNLDLMKGESVGLIGHNGSGKSTLLKILAFIDPTDQGCIGFNGSKGSKNGEKTGENLGLKRSITLLFQEPYLIKRSVFENVAYGLKVRGWKENVQGQVCEVLQLVGLSPRKFAHRRWYELSGGEAQRVALASRLVFHPEVLLLDEPTANVDHHSADQIKHAIHIYRKRYNTTLVIASHDLIWLNSVTNRILKMHEGHIVGRGNDNILSGPWLPDENGLWSRLLSDGQRIRSINPPSGDAIAILSSSNIMISTELPAHISAQNILQGTIAHMSADYDNKKVQIEVLISGIRFTCSLTHRAADTLSLLPGKSVWIVFKASSLIWH